ncbi:MAG TPA: hypothetical protein VFE78_06925 [Gemmataceae bacterium]|jgi:hypothetical protein|nr:hypothetical protein [Gemmataceae bacterium]
MSSSASLGPERGAVLPAPAGFVCAALGVAVAAAVLAGWAPVRFSIVTVFLFAGPHNWLEARYFLTRMPARWGRLRGFFLLAFAGIFALTAAFAALLWLGERGALDPETWEYGYALLNTALVLWVALLVHLRSRQNPRRDWAWVWPVAFALIAVAWLVPPQWGLGLVYLHPLLALWLLDRELRRSRPEWRPAYHACLACLPLFLGVLWWKLADAPPLASGDELTQRITQHAGAGLLPGVSSHLLVSTHTFLEMLHYGVWVVAIPLIGLRAVPWRLAAVPMASRGVAWRRGLAAFLTAGLCVVLALWACFLVDYATTRTVYFTVAMLHVLAEAPFLLRAL